MSSNNYLIKSINALENLAKDPEDSKIVTDFIFELKMSNLYVPGMDSEDGLIFETLLLDDGNLAYLPLFSSEKEFYKCYGKDSEYEPIENEFEIYAAIAEEENVSGIIIDIESLCFEVPPEIIEIAKEDFSISYDDIPTRSLEEITQAYESDVNGDLLNFIEDDENDEDFEGIMVELSYSSPLNLVVSEEPLDEFAENGVIRASDVGGFSLCTMQDEQSSFAILFTDKDAILKAIPEDDGLHYYGQLTRVSELFEYVLRNDMDGVVINPNGSEFFIPRSEILSQASGIELIAEDASFRNCLEYAFIL